MGCNQGKGITAAGWERTGLHSTAHSTHRTVGNSIDKDLISDDQTHVQSHIGPPT